MRKVAKVRKKKIDAKWLILYQTETDVYLFYCASDYDGSSMGDDWFSSVAEAETACAEIYGVQSNDWIIIPDPLPGCQADWLSTVRIRGRDIGKPEWGTLECLIEEKWLQIKGQSWITIKSIIESQPDC